PPHPRITRARPHHQTALPLQVPRRQPQPLPPPPGGATRGGHQPRPPHVTDHAQRPPADPHTGQRHHLGRGRGMSTEIKPGSIISAPARSTDRTEAVAFWRGLVAALAIVAITIGVLLAFNTQPPSGTVFIGAGLVAAGGALLV